MSTLRCFAAVLLSTALVGLLPAQSNSKKQPAEKSPADQAWDNFGKIVTDKQAKPGQAHFQKIIDAGLAFLTEYPTHRRAQEMIFGLGDYANSMRDKATVPFRAVWVTQLKFDLLGRTQKEGISDDVRAAFLALEVALTDFEVRQSPSRDNLATLREKIDALTAAPGGSRFLMPAEKSYVEIVAHLNPANGEAYLQKLTEHPEKDVAQMAKEQLNILAIRKAPFELKFKALDGRDVDFTELRGKVVLLNFWSTTSNNSTKDFDALKQVHANYRKRGFELVSVSYDKEADREKLLKYIKDNRLSWPQYFDGSEAKNEFGSKLNVRTGSGLPANFLFDQKGMLVRYNFRANALEGEVKKLLEIK